MQPKHLQQKAARLGRMKPTANILERQKELEPPKALSPEPEQQKTPPKQRRQVPIIPIPYDNEHFKELPTPPDLLNEAGRSAWYNYALVLLENGTLEPKFYPMLLHVARLEEQLHTIESYMLGQPLMMMSAQGPKSHPLIGERTKIMGHIRTALVDIGITPNKSTDNTPKLNLPASRSQESKHGMPQVKFERMPRQIPSLTIADMPDELADYPAETA